MIREPVFSVQTTTAMPEYLKVQTYQDTDAATRRKEPTLQQLFLYKII
jgi:hypothetical protein